MRVIVIILFALLTVSALTYCSTANAMRTNQVSSQVIYKALIYDDAGHRRKT